MKLLKSARPYELGKLAQTMLMNLRPVYIRGEAHLAARDYKSAIGEFQRILEHPGMSPNEPSAALTHLQIARAYGAQGDKDRARSAYQDFLSLRKEVDLRIPVLKQAKAEFSALQ